MTWEQEAHRLAAEVRTRLAVFGRTLATAIRASPTADISQLLARYDIEMALTGALVEVEAAADAAVRRVWTTPGAFPYREQLLADITSVYSGARESIILAVTQAFNSIAVQPLIEPGTNPTVAAGRLRSIAARRAVANYAAELGLRNSLTVSTAGSGSETAAVLAEAELRSSADEDIWIEWRASQDGKDPRSCGWCKALHGKRVRPGEQFPHPQPIGNRQPPRLYMGTLFGPSLHPRCRCKLAIIAGTVGTPPATPAVPPQEQGDFISSDTIKAMGEDEYGKLHHFLRSALHELGLVLRRLIHPND
jgi:hypothetical protein